jgi:hypothetical protein
VNADSRFDPSAYPRTYTQSAAKKAVKAIFFVTLLVAGCVATGIIAAPGESRPDQDTLAILFGVMLLVGLGTAWALISTLRSKIVLTPDAIEVHGAFNVFTLRRQEIGGYTVTEQDDNKILQLKTKPPWQKIKNVTLQFAPDRSFAEWFAGIEDFVAAQKAAEEREVMQDTTLGVTPEARLATARRTTQITTAISIPPAAAMLWAWFFPRPYWLAIAILAVMPWIAYILAFAGRNKFVLIGGPKKSHGKIELAALIMGPAIGLALRAFWDINLVDPVGLILPVASVAVIMTGGLLLVNPALREDLRLLAIGAAVLVAYVAGAIPLGNALLDKGPSKVYSVKVLGMHQTWGKGGKSNYLHLAPWGPEMDVNEIRVSSDYYSRSTVGSTACIRIRAGAFGLHWYHLDAYTRC